VFPAPDADRTDVTQATAWPAWAADRGHHRPVYHRLVLTGLMFFTIAGWSKVLRALRWTCSST